jgi:multiple sugar transport system permease protein
LKISDRTYGFLLNVPGLLIVFLWVVLPAGLLVMTSFLRYDNLSPIVFNGLQNYRRLFTDRLLWISLRKVAVFSSGTTLMTFVGGLLLALALAGVRTGSAVFRSMMIIPWAVPPIVSGIIWKWIFSPDFGVLSDLLMKVGLIAKPISIYSNPGMAMVGVIVADSWTRIPFMGIILLAALLAIDRELYEAAKIDGAGALARFGYISLPLIRGPMFVGLMITIMFSFRTIDIIIPLTAGGPGRSTYVFGYYIYDQLIKTLNFGVMAAAGMVLFGITTVISMTMLSLSRRS